MVRTLPHGRELRIVEIGAGIGSATASVVPVLPAGRGIYCFTDVSKVFLDHAREKYRNNPSLRFALLDIEKDPTAQGFGEHEFDVVVACNVLHATGDLDDTMRNVTRLLRPAGVLVLCEVTTPQSWIEFCYGLMPGWYRFHDRLRRNGPLLADDDWTKLLSTHGLEDVTSFPEVGSPAGILGEHCIVARIPSSARASGEDRRTASVLEGLPEDAAPAVEVSNRTPDSQVETFLQRLRQSAPGEQREQLVEFVRKHVMNVLRREAAETIGSRQRLMDLGIDSLMAVELRNALTSALKLTHPLPATLIFDYPNIDAIAEYLTSQVLALGSASTVSSDEHPIDRQTTRPLSLPSSVENLSDEDVEKLLLENWK
jgi:SAM-dependent methyltransferase/acyl carrier protein